MYDAGELKVSAFETNIGNLDMEDISYGAVASQLKRLGLKILYETRVNVPTNFQRRLYVELLVKIPKDILLFLDPIVLSLARARAAPFGEILD